MALSAAQKIQASLPGSMKNDEIQKTGPQVLTIKEWGTEEVGFGGEKELKPVLRFLQTAKYCIINASRAEQIAELFPDQEDLAGEKVMIDFGPYEIRGKVYDQIRINAPE
jgi:hypothetical protein